MSTWKLTRENKAKTKTDANRPNRINAKEKKQLIMICVDFGWV